ncbi:hypothetical protein [Dysgonomonas sp. Marseille-P4361]|uniref:hypothetical protein n=1 Tax=Dysgonomonas sp. Marseille-P4361 TaxID=2161820 RepID=UPI000D55C717|nr:hypothetical protein [Dysgonomonas sp. Marseille-P4361]
MKYLYYSLYIFFVKIIRVQQFWSPIISITGVMAFLIISLCFSVVNAYEYDMRHKYPMYSVLIPISLFIILDKILYNYYKTREAKLLKEMESKPLWVKITSILGSLLFIVLVVKLWMFDGMSDLYQLVKQHLFQNK